MRHDNNNDVLRDGESARVPMMMRDAAMTPVQRAVAGEASNRSFADICRDAERRREEARQAWIDTLQWKPPEERAQPRHDLDAAPRTGSPDFTAARRSDYPTSAGDTRFMFDIAEAERRREAAYQDYRRSLNDASRGAVIL